MKSILDPSFFYTPSIRTDVAKTFQKVWRELEAREQAKAAPDSYATRLLLQCSEELVSIGEVELAGLRSRAGTELIRFVCPRCRETHESPRFR